MNYNEVWFSPSRYQEKPTGSPFFNVGPKRRFLLNKYLFVTFLARSSEMLDFFEGWHFQDIVRSIQKSKNIACSMSQSVTN